MEWLEVFFIWFFILVSIIEMWRNKKLFVFVINKLLFTNNEILFYVNEVDPIIDVFLRKEIDVTTSTNIQKRYLHKMEYKHNPPHTHTHTQTFNEYDLQDN